MSSDILEGQIGQEQINFSSALSLSFNKQIARIHGINAAIVFNHILYWLNINATNPAAQKMGKTWMYETQEKMSEFLDCLSRREIQNALNILEEAGLIIRENLNDNPFVRTNWYTVGDQNMLSRPIKKSVTKAPASAMSSPAQCFAKAPASALNIEQDKQKTNKEEDNKKSSGGSYISLEKSSEKLFESAAAAVPTEIFSFMGNNSRIQKISRGEIYRHFLDRKYDAKFIEQVIYRLRERKSAVGNIFKVLDFIAKDLLDAEAFEETTKNKPKKKESTYEPIKNPTKLPSKFFTKKGKEEYEKSIRDI